MVDLTMGTKFVPYTKKDLASDLRALMVQEIPDKLALQSWYEKARLVQESLTGMGDFPHSHFIDHYLIDADTRLKDPGYANIQNEVLLTVLRELDFSSD